LSNGSEEQSELLSAFDDLLDVISGENLELKKGLNHAKSEFNKDKAVFANLLKAA